MWYCLNIKMFLFSTAMVSIWIIGDSYVRRGEQRALETMGNNLGVDAVTYIHWFGWGGLRWRRLIPFLHQALQGRKAPDVLLIHCGGNDLGDITGVKLVAAMKEDLHQLHLRFPKIKILFSALTQRRRWKADAKAGKIDKGRRFVNSVMATYVNSLGGTFVDHPHIRFDTPGLFLYDDVHLTNRGNDMFLNSFAVSIKAQLQQQ